jgi:hypothetical protein
LVDQAQLEKPSFRSIRKTLLQKALENAVFGAISAGRITIRKIVRLRMASPTQAYLTPLYFIGSLSHTDFSPISCSLFEELLQEARVAFEQDAYMLDTPPYTTPAIDQCF